MVSRNRLLALLIVALLLLGACESGAEEVTDDAADGGGATGAVGTTEGADATEATGATEGGDVAAGGDTAGGCDNAATLAVIEEVEGLEGEEREQFLIERANEAGGVISFYTEISEFSVFEDAFEERYPDSGLELTTYRAGSDQVRQRILEEAAANFQGADLVEMEALELAILANEGILAPSSSPWRDEVVEAGQFEDFTAIRFSYILPVWNNSKVDEAPQALDDFATAKYEDVALEDSDVYWFAVLVQHFEEQGMSREQAVDIFREMAANAEITHGHTSTAELIAGGQYGISPNMYLHTALQLQQEGAPVEWQPVNVPVVAEINGVSVVCSAKNPAGALLLQDFFLDPEAGQTVLAEQQRTPSNVEKQAEQLGGVEIDPIRGDVHQILEDFEMWSELWDETIRLQG